MINPDRTPEIIKGLEDRAAKVLSSQKLNLDEKAALYDQLQNQQFELRKNARTPPRSASPPPSAPPPPPRRPRRRSSRRPRVPTRARRRLEFSSEESSSSGPASTLEKTFMKRLPKPGTKRITKPTQQWREV